MWIVIKMSNLLWNYVKGNKMKIKKNKNMLFVIKYIIFFFSSKISYVNESLG